MKRLLLVPGAVGVVLCFAAIGHGATLSNGHMVDTQMFYRVLVALGVVFALGCSRGPFRAWEAAVACACSGFVLLALRDDFGVARNLVIVTAAGLAVGIAGLVRATRSSCSRSPSSPATSSPR